MSRSSLGLLGVILLVALVGIGMNVRRSHVRLQEMNAALQQQLALSRLSADNLLLSNSIAQARLVETSVQELVKLRSEVNRLRQEKDEFIQTNQAKLVESSAEQLRELTALRTEISGLGDEVFSLREAVQELYEGAGTAAPVQEQTASGDRNRTNEDRTMSIRIIETRGEIFANNLKRSASAEEGETFQDVFGRYLRAHGVDLGNVAGLAYDERSGRVIVRATRPALDTIERLAVGLQQSE